MRAFFGYAYLFLTLSTGAFAAEVPSKLQEVFLLHFDFGKRQECNSLRGDVPISMFLTTDNRIAGIQVGSDRPTITCGTDAGVLSHPFKVALPIQAIARSGVNINQVGSAAPVFTLKSPNIDPARGGRLSITYPKTFSIFGGFSTQTLELQIRNQAGRWIASANGEDISRITIERAGLLSLTPAGLVALDPHQLTRELSPQPLGDSREAEAMVKNYQKFLNHRLVYREGGDNSGGTRFSVTPASQAR